MSSGYVPGISATTSKLLVQQPPQQQQQWRPPPQDISLPLHVQAMEKALDINAFLNQLEKLLATSLESVSSSAFAEAGISDAGPTQGRKLDKKSLLTTKTIWEDDQARKRDLSSMYNFSTLRKRNWLKNVLLEDSDSDSDTEQMITERDVKILLKIHKYRRKYQKRYHTDILNSQYTYFGAGLLSEHNRFPEHQKFILDEYGFSFPGPAPAPATSTTVSTAPASSPKKPTKRRRNRQGTGSNAKGNALGTGSYSSNVAAGPKAGNGQQVASDFTPPMALASHYPYFAVPLAKSGISTVLVDNKLTAAVATTVTALARPIPEPPGGDANALRWRAWRSIAVEDIPKAHTERIIQRKYHSVVLKQIALYCSQFLEQAREAATSGKHKQSGRHGKKHGQLVCLRPVSKQQGTATGSKPK